MELPRPPAFSPGFQALAWGVILGAYVWIGLLAIGTCAGSAFLFGPCARGAIFCVVTAFRSMFEVEIREAAYTAPPPRARNRAIVAVTFA